MRVPFWRFLSCVDRIVVVCQGTSYVPVPDKRPHPASAGQGTFLQTHEPLFYSGQPHYLQAAVVTQRLAEAVHRCGGIFRTAEPKGCLAGIP